MHRHNHHLLLETKPRPKTTSRSIPRVSRTSSSQPRQSILTSSSASEEGKTHGRSVKDLSGTQVSLTSPQNNENLAFQVRINSLDNQDIFVKLDFEFVKDYPKVPLKVRVIESHPDDPKFRSNVENILRSVTKAHIGSECVHEITGAVDDLLNRTAFSKAAKETPYSLEEERAHREAALKLAAEQQQAQLLRQQEDESTRSEQTLATRLESERKKRQDETSKPEDEMEPIEPAPRIQIDFEKSMVCRDIFTGEDIHFRSVDGRYVTLRQPDKVITVVGPSVDASTQHPPQLLLKEIILDVNIAPEPELQQTMREVEHLLDECMEQNNEHVIDLVGYKIQEPSSQNRSWRLSVLSEFANKGSLADMLLVIDSLSPKQVKDWSRQLLEAMIFFDNRGFVHPAVHPGNVLICLSKDGGTTIKLSDGYGTSLRKLVDKAQPGHETMTEPTFWIAPELLDTGSTSTSKACVWDLGKIMLQMVVGKKLFEDFTSPGDFFKRRTLHVSFDEVLRRMFQSNPKYRPTAYDFRTYRFFFDSNPQTIQDISNTLVTRNIASTSRWDNDWESISTLGKGGQGVVYKARKIQDQSVYAVKLLRSERSNQLASLRQEVLLISNLKHPAIVRYYDAWIEGEGAEDNTTATTTTTATGTSETSSFDPRAYDSHAAPDTMPNGRPRSRTPTAVNFADAFTSGLPGTADPYEDEDKDNLNDLRGPEGPTDEEMGDGIQFVGSDPEDDDPEKRIPLGPPELSKIPQPVNEPVAGPISRVEISKLFVQMEYCEKKSINDLLRGSQHIPIPMMWSMFRKILDGLNYMHSKGVVHRDLKPENIFLDHSDEPKIGDFGWATAVLDTSKTHSIGTRPYMAPEVHLPHPGRPTSKVDMYALGIMLFELNYPCKTRFERLIEIEKLHKPNHTLPPQFQQLEFQVQGKIILELIDHDPDKRPSAAELLEREEIPEPVEDAKLRRRVHHIANTDPARLQAMLALRQNDRVADLAWESTESPKGQAFNSVTSDYMVEKLEALFRKHGAVSNSREVLFPKTTFDENPVTVLSTKADSTALVLQLPYDLTVPFARTIAHKKPKYAKSYCIGYGYRDRGAGEPQPAPEIDFDFVSYKTDDLALKEATTISVLDDVLADFTSLDVKSFKLLLNHMDLLDLILEHCHFNKGDFAKIRQQLAIIYAPEVNEAKLDTLRVNLLAAGLAQTSFVELKRFCRLSGNVDSVRSRLKQLFNNPTRFAEACRVLSRLEAVVTHLETLQVRVEVTIAPLSSHTEHLYRGSMMFQLVNKRSGRPYVAGGRYDELVRGYQAPRSEPVRAVGFRLEPHRFVSLLEKAAANSVKSNKGNAGSFQAPGRIDVLVTSFDASVLVSSGLQCVQNLLAAGVSAELTEEVTTMEELDALYLSDAPYWLVIVRGGELNAEKALKVRVPGGESKEVVFGGLGEWLRTEIARKRGGRKGK